VNRFNRFNRFDGACAVVTGASRGLGLAIARDLARHGARLVICARDGDALNEAAWQLRDTGAQVHAVRCDLTEQGAAEHLIAEAEHRYGGVNLLVNNAGMIQVGPFADMRESDFREAMEAMYFAPLRLTLAALPSMRERGDGTIVNVTSIGGRLAAPHLLPYDGAKFALVGLSEGLRAELATSGISVTTVVPGLMRTGSHLCAEFRGAAPREYAWFAAAAALPLLSIDADRAARAIVRAAQWRRPEIILGAPAKIATRLHGIAPATTTRAATTAARLLHAATERDTTTTTDAQPSQNSQTPAGKKGQSGSQAARTLNSRLLGVVTALNDKAARRLNQVRSN
jgi:short-subunit dehydrogenase